MHGRYANYSAQTENTFHRILKSDESNFSGISEFRIKETTIIDYEKIFCWYSITFHKYSSVYTFVWIHWTEDCLLFLYYYAIEYYSIFTHHDRIFLDNLDWATRKNLHFSQDGARVQNYGSTELIKKK